MPLPPPFPPPPSRSHPHHPPPPPPPPHHHHPTPTTTTPPPPPPPPPPSAPAPPYEYIFQLEPGKVDSGKGKCSYDPKLNSVSALINGELYAGVYIDFMGTDSAIFRTLGKQTAMRTDQYNSRWLNGKSSPTEPSQFTHS
ncbi:hypothetical protein CRUP_003557 [Coryphaenoides rupestris]|nr:hypothetical protein CRUP_003557 [Coryphaenoides rupestris]